MPIPLSRNILKGDKMARGLSASRKRAARPSRKEQFNGNMFVTLEELRALRRADDLFKRLMRGSGSKNGSKG